MKRLLGIAAAISYSSVVETQPAQLEVEGVFGECLPVWAAAADELLLYREPDLEAESVRLPFRAGWRIEAPKSAGLTRVLEVGALRVLEPDDRMYCRVQPVDGPSQLVPGETVEYLFDVGEGFGEIRFRGAECQAQVYDGSGHFEIEMLPQVQVWLRVFNADGTSPGWLLHDGAQTRLADVLC